MSGSYFVDLHDERPEPDWNVLAEQNVIGAYLKLGEGGSRIGGRLAAERAARARAAGLFVGFYWFARPDLPSASPQREAGAFAEALNPSRGPLLQLASDWRPVLDLERGLPGNTDVASAARYGADLLHALAQRGFPRLAWYASLSPARQMPELYAWPAWIAAYNQPLPAIAHLQVLAHQYSSTVRWRGYSGDASYFTSGRVARMLARR